SNNSTHKDCLPELVFLFSLFSVEALINSSARLSARLINGCVNRTTPFNQCFLKNKKQQRRLD
ncbi:MAG: hypothetical protein II433_07330, partial [Acidaminococcaceae bacterium]|nr:hypothetical protein [Acidaminococcaceae bacterium]